METPNLDELLSWENFPPCDPLRGDAERELASLKSAIERLRAENEHLRSELALFVARPYLLNYEEVVRMRSLSDLANDMFNEENLSREQTPWMRDWCARYRAATAEGERDAK